MQVTHVNDHVTHAIIGGKKTIDLTMTDNAEFMIMMSSTLYSDQELAVVREVICNAWDAHIEAGCTDTPVQISLDGDKLVIRDFGRGIHHDQIGPIYGVYGKSTKKHDGNQTGGFGLGCKAPFAYTDHFEVISCHDGIKTIYTMSKSSASANGKPGITPIASFSTEETGITVSISLKQPHHRSRFDALIKRIVANGAINATLNNETLDVLPFDQMQHGFLITSRTVYENQPRKIYVRYGNVVYPVDNNAAYERQYDYIEEEILGRLCRGYGHQEYVIVFQAQPHTISVTPSRESLSMQPRTIESLRKLFDDFCKLMESRLEKESIALVRNQVDEVIAENKDLSSFFSRSMELPWNNKIHPVRSCLLDPATIARQHAERKYPRFPGFADTDMNYRLTRLAKAGVGNQRIIKSYQQAYQKPSANKGWFIKEILFPLVQKVEKHPTLQLSRLGVKEYSYSKTGSRNAHDFVSAGEILQSRKGFPLTDCISYLRNIVVISHLRGFTHLLQLSPEMVRLGAENGYFVYTAPRNATKLRECVEFFKKLRMTVVDLTPHQEIDKEERASVTRKKSVKKNGIPKLKGGLLQGGGNAHLSALREGEHELIDNPRFVTRINPKGVGSPNTFPTFPRHTTEPILRLFGEVGGFALTSVQEDKYLDKGAKTLESFLVDKVCVEIRMSKNIARYMGINLEAAINLATEGRTGGHETAEDLSAIGSLRPIFRNPAILKMFGVEVTLTREEQDYLKLWSYINEYRFTGWNEVPPQIILDVRTYLKDIPADPAVVELVEIVKRSHIKLSMLNLSTLYAVLSKPKDPRYEHALNLFMNALEG